MIKSTAGKKEKMARFAALMALGFDENQIAIEMDLHPKELDAMIVRFYRELEVRHGEKSSLRLYLDYVNRQSQLVRDLEGVKNKLRGDDAAQSGKWETGAGATAFVGAVKAQADIFDRIIQTGQSLEVIKAAPKRIEHVGGRAVKELNARELKEAIQDELDSMKRLVNPKKSRHASKVIAIYPKQDSDSDLS